MADAVGINSSTEGRIIFLNEIVEDTSVKPLIESILKWNVEDEQREKKEKSFERQPIKLIVNSRGGSVRDGFALVNTMITSETPVHTYSIGIAASMAFLIAVAGHKRYGYKLSTLMYHQVALGPVGKLKEIEEKVEDIKIVMQMYDEEMIARTALTKEHVDLVKEQKKDWYIYYQDALKLRIIDEVL